MTIQESIKALDEMNMKFKSEVKKGIRCIENGREWESITAFCKEYDLPYVSVASCIRQRGKYCGKHFEYIK